VVRFIDYGNTEPVSVKHVVPLVLDARESPSQVGHFVSSNYLHVHHPQGFCCSLQYTAITTEVGVVWCVFICQCACPDAPEVPKGRLYEKVEGQNCKFKDVAQNGTLLLLRLTYGFIFIIMLL